jgi:hypothetical protein
MAKELPEYAKLLHYFPRGMWIAGSFTRGRIFVFSSILYLSHENRIWI